MVIVVCSAAFAGLLVVPCVQGNKRFAALQKYVYFFMIALGASALFCDAVLHLIPEVCEGGEACEGGEGGEACEGGEVCEGGEDYWHMYAMDQSLPVTKFY